MFCLFFRLLMLCAGLLVGNTSPVEQWMAQWSYGTSLGIEMPTTDVPMRMEWELRHWNGTQGGVAVKLESSCYLLTLKVTLEHLIMSTLTRLQRPISSQTRLLTPPPLSLILMTHWLMTAC